LSIEKVFVIGLDSAPPELLFGEFLHDLPSIRKLVENSIYSPMKSCDPPITIPAWMVMATGKTPGELGLYGFRHRKSGTYEEMWVANSRKVSEMAVWDYIGMEGQKSVLVGIPPSYPPRKVNGWLVSCFITPDASSDYTYPSELKVEIEKVAGEYIFDVVFRKDDRDRVLEEIIDMTERRFEVIRYLMDEKDWSYFQFVEIGLDRIHHAFWKYFDKEHHLHESDSRYRDVIRDYYRLLDREIGKCLKLIDDDTAVMLVSDHGVKRMKGAFAVNQWLIDEGYLSIKKADVKKGTSLENAEVDWDKTYAWGWGGYYSRIFLNVKGRERNGIVEDPTSFREELAENIGKIKGPDGEKWNTRVMYPEEIYPVSLGDRPDIMVYFDSLYWRSAGTLGHESMYLPENDTGPDDAVHSEYGVFLLHHPELERKNPGEISIYDFAPTVLRIFDIEVPLQGRSVL